MVYEIKELYNEISKLKELKPSKRVNHLFGELVKFVTSKQKGTLTKKELINLRKICSKAEFELESYWTKEIIKSDESKEKLKEFPYYNNYEDLTCLEWNSLKACKIHHHHKNTLFIGGGPLPLTAIILAVEYNANVTILDIDKNAVELSNSLIEKLGLRNKVEVISSSAQEFLDYDKFEVIFIASLVGNSIKEKKNIFSWIREKSKQGTHILARSVYGKRKLLYQPLDSRVYNGFKPVIEVRPLNEIINSVIVLRT
jgi:nicotianamine synthase